MCLGDLLSWSVVAVYLGTMWWTWHRETQRMRHWQAIEEEQLRAWQAREEEQRDRWQALWRQAAEDHIDEEDDPYA